ncbi:MAG TPA: class I SAM-dependent methyltransferase [Polyangiaceae bacterium]|nr:class I SAM-dependent methyltransferase [Polyangiaceae bacterium]
MTTYNQLSAEFYDLDKPEQDDEAFAFYAAYARNAQGPILEPMCGSGRFLVRLLAMGLDIEGTDASPFMLAACRRRAEARGLRAVLHQQRIEQTALERRYGLVFLPAGSIGLVTDAAALRASLCGLYELMLPGAKLVLEIDRPPSPVSCAWPAGGRWIKREDGAILVLSWLGQYAASEQISYNLHRYELVRGGKIIETEIEELDVRYHEPEAFETILRSVGFSEIQRWKAFEHSPPTEEDEGIVFECSRP